ncbi:hypothetical protein tb265_46590 [Gemmatimonadetes bacterium T265]|nr:hypothetical protein tb265_46590 [Gemmatimonadetes bacterium T265]
MPRGRATAGHAAPRTPRGLGVAYAGLPAAPRAVASTFRRLVMPVPSFVRRALAAAAALASAAATVRAQQGAQRGAQLLYEWQGRVDHEVQIAPGGRVRGIGGQENPGRFRAAGGAPRGPGQLSVQTLRGRGSVDVIGNNVVRIRDPQGGADMYRVRVYWQPADGGYDRRDRGVRGDQRGDDRRRPADDRRPRPY